MSMTCCALPYLVMLTRGGLPKIRYIPCHGLARHVAVADYQNCTAHADVQEAPPATSKGRSATKATAKPAPAAVGKSAGAGTGSGGDGGKWKKQSEEVRAAMKASREVTRRCAALRLAVSYMTLVTRGV